MNTQMGRDSYDFMKVGKWYESYYLLRYRRCWINKASEDVNRGILTAVFQDGTTKRTHFSMFNALIGEGHDEIPE